MTLDSLGTLLAVLTPLVVVPLTVILFYLRALREQQSAWHDDSRRRVGAVEGAMGELRRSLECVERDYATKEEWLRECLHARGAIEQLSAAVVRMETVLELSEIEAVRVGRERKPARCAARLDGGESRGRQGEDGE